MESSFRSFDRTTRRVIIVAVLLVMAGIAAVLLLTRNAGTSAPGNPHPALTVSTVSPRLESWPEDVVASGAIAPWEEASIGTQIGSYQLIEVRVNVGDQVRRGQLLARLNPALLQAEQAQLLARHEQALANDRRARGLQAVGGISDQEALQYATEAKTATALLAAKRLELRYTSILAPDDGVISARTATLGAVMPAGQELFRMIRRNRLEWRGELTAAQVATIRPGQTVALSLPDGSRAQARVREVAPTLDDQSRLAIVFADILPGSRARARMYVEGAVAIGQSPALTVPSESVVIRDGHSHVMLVGTSGGISRVLLRPVTTGRRSGGSVEILKGVAGSDRLVRRGAAFLDDGDLVSVAGTENSVGPADGPTGRP